MTIPASESQPQPEATSTPAAASRDQTFWAAGGSSRLQVTDAPKGALNLNVTGRRLNSPVQGFGKMWQKTYKAVLPATAATPTQVIAEWKAHFPSFWPKGNAFHGPLTGIAPGDVALLNLSMPGKVKMSTGVMVLYADDESFTLMTPQGHMFAGWITFSAFGQPGSTVIQAQVLMRANDPLYELGLALGGHRKEDKFWQHTLGAVAAHFGVADAKVDVQAVVVDKKRQWNKVRNIWHNALIRSALYMFSAPVRLVAKPFRRRTPKATPSAE
ncbi:MAG: hypothetical protein ABR520_07340 [Mycobacteriales bacterium]|nr:hypothetical protein [Frankia sp.]